MAVKNLVSIRKWKRPGFEISTDPERLDKAWLVGRLRKTYWAGKTPGEVIWQSIEASVPFGLYEEGGGQVGFARVVTDTARFAWVSDVIINEEIRGRGLGVWLMECCLSHPDISPVGQWLLATDDAFGLYEKLGFERVSPDSKYMYRLLDRHTSGAD